MQSKIAELSSTYGARILLLLVVIGITALASDPAAAANTCPEWRVSC